MATRYFRVPHTIDSAGDDLGLPEVVTRSAITYTPDANGLIAVDDAGDQENFAILTGWLEVAPASELPAPPASVSATVADVAASTTAAPEGAPA
jgi:hypothetical protein